MFTWLRQFLLLLVASVAGEFIDQINEVEYPTQKLVWQGVQILSALLVLGVTAWLQWRVHPYALAYQNVR